VVFHSTSRAFVVRYPFIDNFLIDALVGFCPHLVSKLPSRCDRPFLLHLSLPSLLLLVVRLFFSRVLPFYTLCGDGWLRILKLSFFTSCRAGGSASRQLFSFLEIFFRSGYGRECLQQLRIVDIFSMREPSQCLYGNFVFNHFSPGYPRDSCMDVEIFHFHQEFGDIVTIFDRSHYSWGFFRFMGGSEASQGLFGKDMPEQLSFLSRVTYFSDHLSSVG